MTKVGSHQLDRRAARLLEDAAKLDPDVLISTEQLSNLWGIAACTLEGWRRDGCGPKFVRLGSLTRYRKADLESWLARRIYTSTDEYRASGPPAGQPARKSIARIVPASE
jgi:predicted DNA-binding transcriptional regulator AlpA